MFTFRPSRNKCSCIFYCSFFPKQGTKKSLCNLKHNDHTFSEMKNQKVTIFEGPELNISLFIGTKNISKPINYFCSVHELHILVIFCALYCC